MGYIEINNFSVTGDCSLTNSGSVSFSVTGDSPGFVVSEITSSGQFPTSALTVPYDYSVSNLSGGSYFLLVTDAASSTDIVSVYISQGTAVGIDRNNTSCGSNNGTITGTTPYVYGIATY